MKHFGFYFLFSLFLPTLVYGDYSTGQQAYDSGNYTEAFSQWQQSAKEGDANSQFQLGKLYEEGLGVPEKNEQEDPYKLGNVFGFSDNDEQAYHYYNLAAAQGHKKGQEAGKALLEKALKNMDQGIGTPPYSNAPRAFPKASEKGKQ